MSIGKKLLRNTSFIFASSVLVKIINFFFLAYSARVLGPGKFGIYALLGTFAFIFSFLTDSGITPMAIREIARDKEKAYELFNNILALRMGFIVISYGLLVIVVYFLNYSKEINYLIYLTGISIIFTTFSSSFRILYMAFERMAVPSTITVLTSFISTVSGISVLYLGYGLKGLVLIHLLGGFLGAVISGSWIRKNFFKYKFAFNFGLWKSLLKQSVPFALLFFFQQNSRYLNIMLLSKIPGPVPPDIAIGYFNPASSTARLSMMIAASLRQSTLPTLASNRDNPEMVRKIIDRSSKYVLIFISIPLILATTFFPKEIISIIFGKAYLEAAPALTVLGWAYGLHVFNTSASVSISASREINRYISWGALITAINIGLAVPLIIYYSFLGAAIAVLISMILGIAVRSYLLKSIYNIGVWELHDTQRVFVPMVLILGSTWVVSKVLLHPIPLLSFMLASYTVFLFFCKAVSFQEVALIGDVLGITALLRKLQKKI